MNGRIVEKVFDECVPPDGDRYSTIRQEAPHRLPTRAVPFDSLPTMRRAVRLSGSSYFDRGAAGDTRTHTATVDGPHLLLHRFWVESWSEHRQRWYGVAWVSKETAGGDRILRVERLGRWSSVAAARMHARRLAGAVSQVFEQV